MFVNGACSWLPVTFGDDAKEKELFDFSHFLLYQKAEELIVSIIP